MADVPVTPAKANSSGVTVGSAAVSMSASDNYIVRNNKGLVLLFIKTGAGEATITVVTPNSVDGNAIADKTFAVPASTGVVVATFNPSVYNDGSGDIDVSTDDDTGLTMYALEA